MILLLLALQAVVTPSVATGTEKRDIVVLGTSLKDSERDWKACRKRRCPPDEEIKVALIHGENLFVAGDYRKSRAVLSVAIANTRSAAARFPVDVSDLRRAEARVASHLGETDDVRRGMVASRNALKAGLGTEDERTLAQRLQIGDSMMLEGTRPISTGPSIFYNDSRIGALRTYEKVARDAERLDLPEIRGRAMIRIASLLIALTAGNPSAYETRARAALRRITDTTDPRLAVFRDTAVLLAAKMDVARGDPGAVDRLVASYTGPASDQPVLLYAPPIDWNASRDRMATAAGVAAARGTGNPDAGHSDEWIDVSFLVRPDGRVEDVEMLRESGNRRSDWIGPVLQQVAGRRYAPLKVQAGAPGQMRVERHTYTASWGGGTGSRIRRQIGPPRVVILDLTAEQSASTPIRPTTPEPTAVPRG